MVTAELAMAIPSLVLVSSLLLSVIGTASDLSRAADAARSAARAASIGTAQDEVVDRVLRVAPPHSSVAVSVVDGWARVSVSVPPRHWGPLTLPAPPVTAEAPLDLGLAP
ncbi:MAG TPA: TadE family type IV pilus minor pilin [Actinomycetes bacterium]|nr:TadE family type IV pilus minor pilin [Actinomycetes bacterium]